MAEVPELLEAGQVLALWEARSTVALQEEHVCGSVLFHSTRTCGRYVWCLVRRRQILFAQPHVPRRPQYDRPFRKRLGAERLPGRGLLIEYRIASLPQTLPLTLALRLPFHQHQTSPQSAYRTPNPPSLHISRFQIPPNTLPRVRVNQTYPDCSVEGVQSSTMSWAGNYAALP
jgi:hypothetical protein